MPLLTALHDQRLRGVLGAQCLAQLQTQRALFGLNTVGRRFVACVGDLLASPRITDQIERRREIEAGHQAAARFIRITAILPSAGQSHIGINRRIPGVVSLFVGQITKALLFRDPWMLIQQRLPLNQWLWLWRERLGYRLGTCR
ncbi:hypothetical protein D3C85_909870 [compost metagenome]